MRGNQIRTVRWMLSKHSQGSPCVVRTGARSIAVMERVSLVSFSWSFSSNGCVSQNELTLFGLQRVHQPKASGVSQICTVNTSAVALIRPLPAPGSHCFGSALPSGSHWSRPGFISHHSSWMEHFPILISPFVKFPKKVLRFNGFTIFSIEESLSIGYSFLFEF